MQNVSRIKLAQKEGTSILKAAEPLEVFKDKTTNSRIQALIMWLVLCHALATEAGTPTLDPVILNADRLPTPIVTDNSVEVCLNSRYSQHSLGGTANAQQISNILWAAGRAPIIGTHRDMLVATPTGTYLYDPNSHSLSRHSDDVTDDGAFAIIYESGLDFDTGVSFMPALLESVSLWRSTESPVASCPKGIGYPKARLIFGVQSVKGFTTQLAVHSSVAEGDPGWLPDPHTTGENSLEEVLASLNYTNSFTQTNLTLQQISQILWAGYGCTDHTPSGRGGLTVPSAWANFYLTRSIYLANENGVFRYHNRNPSTNLSTRDHRIEQIDSSSAGRGSTRPADARGRLQSAVNGLPEAPCYMILCLDSSSAGQEYAQLEVGFAAGNMLIQATAMDLGCFFNSGLTSAERTGIQAATNIPSTHIPQAIVSLGPIEAQVTISVVLQGNARPDAGWVVPLTIKFFTPGADLMNDSPTYEFEVTSKRSSTTKAAVCEVTVLSLGTYDLTVVGGSTLMNARKNVVISVPQTSVDLGTLLEGDVTNDAIINIEDYAILSSCWLASDSQAAYDIRADLDRNGLVNASDLCLLATNWLKVSPVVITP